MENVLSEAVFQTPFGKIFQSQGFGGVPTIIKNTQNEVIILFNPN
jgi:hypothetical protein